MSLSDLFCVDRFRDEFLELLRLALDMYYNEGRGEIALPNVGFTSALAAFVKIAKWRLSRLRKGICIVSRERNIEIDVAH